VTPAEKAGRLRKPSVVPIDVLETAFRTIMAHLREIVRDDVVVDVDYYWSIPEEAAYDVYREPASLTIGQLSECVDHLRRSRTTPRRS
jgi:hypothetical protein